MSVDQLNRMNLAIVPIIRVLHPTRIIMLEGLQFANPSWITKNPTSLSIPFNPATGAFDSQLMLEIHNYDPFPYAGSNPSVLTWGSDSDVATLTSWVGSIQNWSVTHGLPVYYGEFGCTNAQTAATGRDVWYQAHAAVIAASGWAASVWNDGATSATSGHNVFNYDTETWTTDILADIGHSYTPTPPPPPTPAPPTPAPTPTHTCPACGGGKCNCDFATPAVCAGACTGCCCQCCCFGFGPQHAT